ncbi:MAG: phytanoyl-CoA dioxygenase family protein [Alphaproteobacteria bacterium]|nr:phytanoyl-CoA dioxygenase family protein [Alphaproteobacteria bacterium]MCY4319565.1 phytanoyl-CoA dioxygenase family protein [Alphaproteobacteria bacterium]
MAGLDDGQRDFFWEHGYVVVENAVDTCLLAELRGDFGTWVEESRRHNDPWGDTADGRPRFDLEPGHTAERLGLRRVNAPIEVSEAYFRATTDSRMTDFVATLIGPAVKLHHTKINSKLPGGHTEVKWHQDFPFTPHSNDDIVTALLMVDEVTEENGPLKVLPGSHRGPIHGLWHGGAFTGAVADEVAAEAERAAVVCTGPAGAVCLMHTRLMHGSAPNRSARPRTLHISVYSAEDAVPSSPNPMPNRYEGLMVRGERSGRIRSTAFELQLPQLPTTASFFDQQAKHE